MQSAGESKATVKQPIILSPAISGSSPRSPCGIGAMGCRSPTSFPKQCGPDAGGEALRAGARLPSRDLRYVVDQGYHTRIHFAFLVIGEDWHQRGPEEIVFQASQD